MMTNITNLPHFAVGKIIKGFGRGSSELGIPTANFAQDVVDALPVEVPTGIYYGWAKVDDSEIYGMVMSIGWNPFFENKQKSMETHILHKFDRDLYECMLKVCIVGYLRPEQNFSSLEALIAAINNDILQAEQHLKNTESIQLKHSEYFR